MKLKYLRTRSFLQQQAARLGCEADLLVGIMLAHAFASHGQALMVEVVSRENKFDRIVVF